MSQRSRSSVFCLTAAIVPSRMPSRKRDQDRQTTKFHADRPGPADQAEHTFGWALKRDPKVAAQRIRHVAQILHIERTIKAIFAQYVGFGSRRQGGVYPRQMVHPAQSASSQRPDHRDDQEDD